MQRRYSSKVSDNVSGLHVKACTQCVKYTQCMMSVSEDKEINKPTKCFWRSYFNSRNMTVIKEYISGLASECIHAQLAIDLVSRVSSLMNRSGEEKFVPDKKFIKEFSPHYTRVVGAGLERITMNRSAWNYKNFMGNILTVFTDTNALSTDQKESMDKFLAEKDMEEKLNRLNSLDIYAQKFEISIGYRSDMKPQIEELLKGHVQEINKITEKMNELLKEKCEEIAKKEGVLFFSEEGYKYGLGKFRNPNAKYDINGYEIN